MIVRLLRSITWQPADLDSSAQSSEVVVAFFVDSTGAVRNAVVQNSSRPEFEKAALDAVNRWAFEPGSKGNRPVNTRMEISFAFNAEQRTASLGELRLQEEKTTSWF